MIILVIYVVRAWGGHGDLGISVSSCTDSEREVDVLLDKVKKSHKIYTKYPKFTIRRTITATYLTITYHRYHTKNDYGNLSYHRLCIGTIRRTITATYLTIAYASVPYEERLRQLILPSLTIGTIRRTITATYLTIAYASVPYEERLRQLILPSLTIGTIRRTITATYLTIAYASVPYEERLRQLILPSLMHRYHTKNDYGNLSYHPHITPSEKQERYDTNHN